MVKKEVQYTTSRAEAFQCNACGLKFPPEMLQGFFVETEGPVGQKLWAEYDLCGECIETHIQSFKIIPDFEEE